MAEKAGGVAGGNNRAGKRVKGGGGSKKWADQVPSTFTCQHR